MVKNATYIPENTVFMMLIPNTHVHTCVYALYILILKTPSSLPLSLLPPFSPLSLPSSFPSVYLHVCSVHDMEHVPELIKVSMTPQVPWYIHCVSYRGGTMFSMIVIHDFFSENCRSVFMDDPARHEGPCCLLKLKVKISLIKYDRIGKLPMQSLYTGYYFTLW